MVRFRASQVHALLGTSTKKDETLTLGAKTLITDMVLRNELGYHEEVVVDSMYKGLMFESRSIGLVNSVLGPSDGYRQKNEDIIENDWVTGTPDIILDEYIEDIKTSENLRTFVKSDVPKAYEVQLQTYMWLTGRKKARLIYCLLPDDETIIASRKNRLLYKFNYDDKNKDYLRLCDQIDTNNEAVNKLPKDKQIRVFDLNYDQSIIDLIKERVELAQDYYEDERVRILGN